MISTFCLLLPAKYPAIVPRNPIIAVIRVDSIDLDIITTKTVNITIVVSPMKRVASVGSHFPDHTNLYSKSNDNMPKKIKANIGIYDDTTVLYI